MTPSIFGMGQITIIIYCIIILHSHSIIKQIKIECMLSAKDVAVVYETLLSSPGMNDAVKITLTVPRRNALLLAKVIESGLNVKDELQAGLLSVASKESLMKLNDISSDLLEKSGLTNMYQKLNSLQPK